MPVVEKTRTVLSEAAIVDALHAGHIAAFSISPSQNRLATAYAQVCLETGCGKSMFNFNMGNITCWSSDPCDQFPLTSARLNGDAARTLRYRSYASAEDGAAQYWRTLAGHYAASLALFDGGDEAAIARQLGKQNYFKSPVAEYAAALTSLARRFATHFAERAEALTADSDTQAAFAGAPDAASMRAVVSRAESSGPITLPEILITA